MFLWQLQLLAELRESGLGDWFDFLVFKQTSIFSLQELSAPNSDPFMPSLAVSVINEAVTTMVKKFWANEEHHSCSLICSHAEFREHNINVLGV